MAYSLTQDFPKGDLNFAKARKGNLNFAKARNLYNMSHAVHHISNSDI
jgi:hypothetical protein